LGACLPDEPHDAKNRAKQQTINKQNKLFNRIIIQNTHLLNYANKELKFMQSKTFFAKVHLFPQQKKRPDKNQNVFDSGNL
jgi:hypothetical protein